MMDRINISLWMDSARGALLPLSILALVVLMIVPVPTILLDMGFVTNIVISMAVLMVALNAAKPLDFSSFPTVLLLATLFRLALNVASTRVVLVNGHEGHDAAGQVIAAFGSFLIGGDYIVGIFVFAVLMIINLVVITKGAGRVSEVSARFTLDALPGKQMAIDADLNAGLIAPDEARQRRQDVATEADFYGSMDGASKFVKGDAIAGLLILIVNIVGGIILGVASHGLSLSQAAETYILLAIGDALVAQVPALLLSVATASIVTRVTSPLDLSGQIGGQFANRRAWGPVAVIMAILAMLPGMPHLIMLIAAGVCGTIYWRLRDAGQGSSPVPNDAAPNASTSPEIHLHDIADDAPVSLEIGYGLIAMVDERKGAPLMARLTGIRRQLSKEIGFVLPLIRVRDDLALPACGYRISVSGVTMGEDEIAPDGLLALDSGDCLTGVTGLAVKDPSFGLDALWIDEAQRADAIVAGYTVVDPATVIATHVNTILSGCGAELFGLDDAHKLIENLKDTAPQLAQNLSPQPYSLAVICGICKGLLTERVPLRDFRRIASALAELAGFDLDQAALLEATRQRIGALIVQGIAPQRLPLPVITFESELESLIDDAVRIAPKATWPIEPALASRIVEAVTGVAQPLLIAARNFAIVTSPAARPAISRLLRTHIADVPVLSFLELPEARAIDVLAVIGGAAPGNTQEIPSATTSGID